MKLEHIPEALQVIYQSINLFSRWEQKTREGAVYLGQRGNRRGRTQITLPMLVTSRTGLTHTNMWATQTDCLPGEKAEAFHAKLNREAAT